jgi:hypothetical protein
MIIVLILTAKILMKMSAIVIAFNFTANDTYKIMMITVLILQQISSTMVLMIIDLIPTAIIMEI